MGKRKQLYFLAITTNDIEAVITDSDNATEYFTEHDDVTVYVILNEKSELVTPSAIQYMLGKWKSEFMPSELPLTKSKYDDIPEAFLSWLERQGDLNYICPTTDYHLCTMPIYDTQDSLVVE